MMIIFSIPLKSLGFSSLMYSWYVSSETLLSNSPSNDSVTPTNKGMELNKVGKYNESITYFDRALAIDPKNVVALNEKGNAYGGLGNYSRTISSYNKATPLDPEIASILDNKGVVFYHLGNYTEAITYYDLALSIDPTVVFASYDKGNALEALEIIQVR